MTNGLENELTTFTIRVPGDLLSTTVEAVRGEFAGLLAGSAGQPGAKQKINLDLTAANAVDSVGLNLIVTLLKAVQKNGGQMRVTCRNPNVHRVLLFTRLDQHLELVKV